MMNIVIFEDDNFDNFYPFSINHSAFEVRIGTNKNLDRILNVIKTLFDDYHIYLIVRSELADLIKERYPDFSVNPKKIPEGLYLNGSAIYSYELIKLFLNEEFKYSNNNNLIACKNHNDIMIEDFYSFINESLSVTKNVEIDYLNYIWDLFPIVEKEMHLDFNTFYSSHDYYSHISLIKVNDDKIAISDNVQINAGVILDASNGPIIIDQDAIINNGAIIEGPVYIGKKTVISSGSKIRSNTYIGDSCKVGGEVSNSIFQGYSNKVHDGFLGHSFIGEWVNIGAGTNNSNLKNNYGLVNISLNNKIIPTNHQFLGSFIGDYTRVAIGTNFNTGVCVGFAANIFNYDMSQKHIDSFSWGNTDFVDLEKLISTIKIMKKRRKINLHKQEEIYIENLYNKLIIKNKI